MFKAAIHNYKNYIVGLFICMGIISLAILTFSLLFRLSFYLPFQSDIEGYNSFVEDIKNYLSTIDITYMFDSGFLSDTGRDVYDIFDKYNTDFSVGTFLIVISVAIVITGYLLSQFFVRRMIKKEVKNRDTIKSVYQLLVRMILNILFWVIFFAITLFWRLPLVLLPLILVCLDSLKILIATWIIYFKKYEITSTISISNIFKLSFSNSIFMYSHYMIFLLILPFINFYVLLFFIVSFNAYLSTIANYTATHYLMDQRSKRQLKIAKRD